MTDPVLDANQSMDLRLRATGRLTVADPAEDTPARAARSLAVLHALASSPATAADALAVLHELQVHQVELELQAEELRDSRTQLEAALRRQVELYDGLPAGCFAVDRDFVVRELNRAGAEMLGVDPEAARGLVLDAFVAAGGADTLQQLAGRMDDRGRAHGTLIWRSPRAADRAVHAELSRDTAGPGYFVAMMETAAR